MLQLPSRCLSATVSPALRSLVGPKVTFAETLHRAASTVAANIMLRSTIAAGFPLFSTQLFEDLGVQWAGTLLACLAAAMIPIPLVFRAYGATLRRHSKLLGKL